MIKSIVNFFASIAALFGALRDACEALEKTTGTLNTKADAFAKRMAAEDSLAQKALDAELAEKGIAFDGDGNVILPKS